MLHRINIKSFGSGLCVVTKVEIEAKNAFNCATKCASIQFLLYWAFSMPTNGRDDVSFSAFCHLYRNVEDCDFVHPDRLEEEDELDGEPGYGEHGGDEGHEAHHPPLVPHALCARSSTDRCLKFLYFCFCCVPEEGMIMKLILKRRLIDPIMDPFISSPR